MKLLIIALTAIIFTACDTVVIPPQLGPIRDRTMECMGGSMGECRTGSRGGEGGL